MKSSLTGKHWGGASFGEFYVFRHGPSHALKLGMCAGHDLRHLAQRLEDRRRQAAKVLHVMPAELEHVYGFRLSRPNGLGPTIIETAEYIAHCLTIEWWRWDIGASVWRDNEWRRDDPAVLELVAARFPSIVASIDSTRSKHPSSGFTEAAAEPP